MKNRKSVMSLAVVASLASAFGGMSPMASRESVRRQSYGPQYFPGSPIDLGGHRKRRGKAQARKARVKCLKWAGAK